MVQSRRRLRLDAKPRDVGRAREVASQEHLEGHDTSKTALHRAIDDAHPPAADLLDEFVVAEGRGQRRATRDEAAKPFSARLDARGRRRRLAHDAIGIPRENRRLLRHGIGHRHRREELAQVTAEVRMLPHGRFEKRVGFVADRLGERLHESHEPFLLLRRERRVERTAPGSGREAGGRMGGTGHRATGRLPEGRGRIPGVW